MQLCQHCCCHIARQWLNKGATLGWKLCLKVPKQQFNWLVLQCRGRERLQSTGCLLQQNGSGPGNSCAMHQDSNNNKMAILGVQQSIAMATINRLSAMAEWWSSIIFRYQHWQSLASSNSDGKRIWKWQQLIGKMAIATSCQYQHNSAASSQQIYYWDSNKQLAAEASSCDISVGKACEQWQW